MKQAPPPSLTKFDSGMRCASLDGDADRLVYYYRSVEGAFKLLDGDKIATLAAGYVMKLVKESPAFEGTRVGLVQTAYANGASTVYARDVMGVDVVFTQTGVKHLHHAAVEFDVGVYFEANGHGTVLFSDEVLKKCKGEGKGTKLASMARVVNQAVGDGLSDLLMVEGILKNLGLGLAEWDSAYCDLPSRQIKIKVADRLAFVTEDADRIVVSPVGLQERINGFVKGVGGSARCFVRPSGTEDCVRVYCEAGGREDCDALAEAVCGVVFDEFGGVGERPGSFLAEV
jgi:phosphoacetylglucosamine mutase